MSQSQTAKILVSASEPTGIEDVTRILLNQNHEIVPHLFNDLDLPNISEHHLVILEASQSLDSALTLCRQLRLESTESYLPILLVTDDHSPATRLAGFEAGVDTCLLRPFASEELLAQVDAFLRIQEVHHRLAEKTEEVHRMNKRLQQAYQQIDHEMELAKRIQSSFLPQSFPNVPPIRFAVHYLLCDQVGGDFYDVFRLDEKHVGFYVADAMGHGVPASLLTIFVKKGVQPKEVFGNNYRLLPPAEVLQKLNRDLLDQQLADHPFITMVYVLFNHVEGTLQFSRAGHPYPVYVPKSGPVQHWEQPGILIGVFEAQFENREERLNPGDKLLLYSDGIDEAQFGDHEPGTESLLASVEHHRDLGIDAMIRNVAQDLFGGKAPTDDLTLFGVEVQEENRSEADTLPSAETR